MSFSFNTDITHRGKNIASTSTAGANGSYYWTVTVEGDPRPPTLTGVADSLMGGVKTAEAAGVRLVDKFLDGMLGQI